MCGRIIFPDSFEYVVNLEDVFNVLGDAREYNWLLSFYDCNHYPSEKIPFDKDYVWLSGDEFVDIVTEHSIQFIWGVAMAFTKDVTLEDVLQHPIQSAEEYMGYLYPTIIMQNPLSVVEIAPIDSTYLFVISKSQEIVEKFATAYSHSEDLAEYNRKRPMNVRQGTVPCLETL